MRLIHSAAGLCMMLLACSVHTETMAASQKVNVGAADAQERAGVGQRGGAIDSNIGRSDAHSQHMELEEGRGGEECVEQQTTQFWDGCLSGAPCSDGQRDAQAAMTEGGSNRV